MIYLDTSAFVKLVRVEPETDALVHYLTERKSEPLVSSALELAAVVTYDHRLLEAGRAHDLPVTAPAAGSPS